MPLFKGRAKKHIADPKIPSKAPKQEKQEKREKFTGIAFETKPLKAKVGRNVQYVGRATTTAVVPDRLPQKQTQTQIQAPKTDTSSGWNPLSISAAIAGAAGVAWALPVVAVSGAVVVGCGAVGYAASAMMNQYREIRESDNMVKIVETITEANVENHRIEAQERVITRMIEREEFEGMYGYGGSGSAGYLESGGNGAIEYLSDS